jgi:transcriptional regulator with XRE-family HTH domain
MKTTLRVLRVLAGLTQRGLAELAQTTQATVARYESGRHARVAQPQVLVRYAEALHAALTRAGRGECTTVAEILATVMGEPTEPGRAPLSRGRGEDVAAGDRRCGSVRAVQGSGGASDTAGQTAPHALPGREEP